MKKTLAILWLMLLTGVVVGIALAADPLGTLLIIGFVAVLLFTAYAIFTLLDTYEDTKRWR